MANETPPNPETDDDGTVDLEGLVGGILDERGFTAERSARLDLLDGLEGRLLEAFKTSGGTGSPSAPQASTTFDEAGFLAKVDALISDKMKGVTPGENGGTSKESKGGGWLSKWLGLTDG